MKEAHEQGGGRFPVKEGLDHTPVENIAILNYKCINLASVLKTHIFESLLAVI